MYGDDPETVPDRCILPAVSGYRSQWPGHHRFSGNGASRSIYLLHRTCRRCLFSDRTNARRNEPGEILQGHASGNHVCFFQCILCRNTCRSTWNVPKSLVHKREIASFVLPLGATINMDGTAIYQGVCAIFIASCYGIQLTLPQMLTIVLTATLASIGTAGVPGAGMVMLAMVLTSVGLPVDGIALVAGVDRIFDMGRTTVNITGDAACTMVVSNLEAKKEARRAAK